MSITKNAQSTQFINTFSQLVRALTRHSCVKMVTNAQVLTCHTFRYKSTSFQRLFLIALNFKFRIVKVGLREYLQFVYFDYSNVRTHELLKHFHTIPQLVQEEVKPQFKDN